MRHRLFDLIGRTKHLDWLLLTKRPQNVAGMTAGYFGRGEPLPGNVWLGTSVEDQEAADARIPHLLRVPARVRFLSMEPLLGPVNLRAATPRGTGAGACVRCGWGEALMTPNRTEVDGRLYCPDCRGLAGIHWVIVGGESGPGARPMHPDWARSLRDQCQAAGVPFFHKQNGEYAPQRKCLGCTCIFGERCGHGRGEVTRDETVIEKVGKKAAGRLLDGRTWDEFPNAS